MDRFATLLLLASITAACSEQRQPSLVPSQPLSAQGQPRNVSIIHLISTPERYDGQVVRVIGFYRAEFEGTAIYLHREDYDHGLSGNGLWLSKTDRECDLKYVIVEGRFNARDRGHMGAFGGTIDEVTRLEPWR